MQNYGVHGLAPIATNSYAGYFSGEVMITADAYVLGGTLVTSDENLKTNVEDLDGSLGIVMQMHPKRYLFLQEALPQAHLQEGPQVGLMAQDLEQVLPEAVGHTTVPAERDSTGEVIYPAVEIAGIDYNKVTPVLVGALQEQQVMIAAHGWPSLKTASTNAAPQTAPAWLRKAASVQQPRIAMCRSNACSSYPTRWRILLHWSTTYPRPGK
jgi:hypothetical protein